MAPPLSEEPRGLRALCRVFAAFLQCADSVPAGDSGGGRDGAGSDGGHAIQVRGRDARWSGAGKSGAVVVSSMRLSGGHSCWWMMTSPGPSTTPRRVSRQRVRLRAGHSQSSESGAAKPSVPLDLTQIPGLSPTDRTAGAAGPSGQALNAPNGTKGSVGLLGLLGTGRQMNAVQVTAMGRDGAGASAGASASAGADGARWAGWGGLGAHGGAGAGTGLNPPMANEVTLDSTSLLPAATGEGGAGQRHRRLPGDKGARVRLGGRNGGGVDERCGFAGERACWDAWHTLDGCACC